MLHEYGELCLVANSSRTSCALLETLMVTVFWCPELNFQKLDLVSLVEGPFFIVLSFTSCLHLNGIGSLWLIALLRYLVEALSFFQMHSKRQFKLLFCEQ